MFSIGQKAVNMKAFWGEGGLLVSLVRPSHSAAFKRWLARLGGYIVRVCAVSIDVGLCTEFKIYIKFIISVATGVWDPGYGYGLNERNCVN